MQEEPDKFDRIPTAVFEREPSEAEARPPAELLVLFGEACAMYDARWGTISGPDGTVYRNFARCSRPGFSPRFGSGKNAAPKPAKNGLEVTRELDGWLLELVFDDATLTYAELSRRLDSLLIDTKP